MRTAKMIGLSFLVVLLATLWNWNHDTVVWSRLPMQMTMADTPWIIQGYHRDTSPLAKHLWLTGPWIETLSVAAQGKYYRQFFRPLASWDMWLAVRAGLTHGFLWVSRSTLILFMGTCLLCASLAWRLTRSELCTLGAAILCCDIRFIDTDTPTYWIAWFPIRQDLFMLSFLMAALIGFDIWKGAGRNKSLWIARLCVLLGCLTKEYDYVMALMVPLLLLNNGGKVEPAVPVRRLRQEAGGIVGLVLCIAAYRQVVLPHPNHPAYKWFSWTTHPLFDLAHPYYLYVNGRVYWMAFLALGLFFGGGLLIRATAQHRHWVRSRRFWLGAAAALGVFFLVDVLANGARISGDLTDDAWYLLDVSGGGGHVFLLLCMVGYAYVYYLVYKHRRQTRSVTAFGLMALAYLPVVGLDGFHYWFGGAVMRAIFWPTMAQVMWADIAPGAIDAARSLRALAGKTTQSQL